MGYNLNGLSLFNQNASASNLFVTQNNTVFSSQVGFGWTSAYGQSIAPLFFSSLSGSVSFSYGQNISGSISSSSTISNVYGLNIDVNINGGTISSVYNLYVSPPTATLGSIVNICTAFFGLPSVGTNQGGVGIGTTTPTNALDIYGGMSIGNYAGTQTVSFGVVAIGGQVPTTPCMGVGTPHPSYFTDIQGTMQAGAAYGWMPMGIQQKGTLSQGWNSLGGGTVGNNKKLTTFSVSFFNPQIPALGAQDSYSVGWDSSCFDGRYIYFAPEQFYGFTFAGYYIRYDTTLPFAMTTSYTSYKLTNVNSQFSEIDGLAFDGRYIYMTLINVFGSSIYFARQDTWAPFDQTASYSLFDMSQINSLITQMISPVFTGSYVYFLTNKSNLLVRYSVDSGFDLASSYNYFSLGSLVVGLNGLSTIGYDGQFIYIANDGSPTVNCIISYDETKEFSSSLSYEVFSLLGISNLSVISFNGASFDGRYIYFCPTGAFGGVFSGQVLRYDTTLAFTTTTSWVLVDLGSYGGSNYTGFDSTIFDGRYVYFAPCTLGVDPGLSVLARYDTLMPFNITAGFSFIDFSKINSLYTAFCGVIYDGNYVYLSINQHEFLGRIDAYKGYQLSSLFASNQASNGFALGTGITNIPLSLTVSSGTLQVPSLPVGYITLQGENNIIRKIPYYN